MSRDSFSMPGFAPVSIPVFPAEPGPGGVRGRPRFPVSREDGERKEKIKLPSQAKLSAILKDLGWTMRQFADELGIGMPRLSSYLHGTTDVPEHILNLAVALYNQELVGLKKSKAQFEQWSMRVILERWAKEAGIHVEDNKQLGAIIGVSESTISRWKHQVTRPSLQSIERYNSIVENYAKVAVTAKEKLQELQGVKHG
jgi:transcriptional regulator with XRE-family HTH domain